MRKKTVFWLAFFVLTLFEAALLVYAQDGDQQFYSQVAEHSHISEHLQNF